MTRILFLFISAFFLVSCGGNAEDIDTSSIASDFTLEDAFGNSFTLSDYRDKSPVVVYFYPKANTSGCTKQACGIRDDYSKFEKSNIVVFGISVIRPPDSRWRSSSTGADQPLAGGVHERHVRLVAGAGLAQRGPLCRGNRPCGTIV